MEENEEQSMKRMGELMHTPSFVADDPDDAKYSLIMHGLCKKYGVKEPLERHIFSIIENMSRNMLCVYKLEQFAKYSGGTPEEIERVLEKLEHRNCIVRGKAKQTNGWRLTEEVRRSAKWFKEAIKLKTKHG
ncbi:MAG: hypothetical protein NT019_01105 [Candidatus Adlerbacteria bacterium]|nr:hypothetical protein [Candidatus Adlerbacteria bacterium]